MNKQINKHTNKQTKQNHKTNKQTKQNHKQTNKTKQIATRTYIYFLSKRKKSITKNFNSR